ncbi:nitrate reductase associated protein [Oxalicibacterium solurbis]|uniref:Nitrate reductase associated protein n=1 Tax=Oxalicibacterium solurbis TaxID=69280 RepID=A0A8J3F2X4_9BURK|nr:nitrate reductase associated protein [Oxalicibacterium solurbis]GGI52982.1 hypothetical protein GCM10011430_01560 [Oxalicibacterium solurbis]
MVTLFDFEQNGGYALRRIPMIMRLKLDVCCLRISLAAWQALSRDEREELVAMPFASDEQRATFRTRLATMLAPHADDPEMAVEQAGIDPSPAWQQKDTVPQDVIDTLDALSLPAITQVQWANLNELQRFALSKLTRPGHRNAKLLSALREFGLG